MIYGKGKSFMEKLVPFFEKANAVGGMTKDLQQEIFHSLATRYSCFPLAGSTAQNPKKPKFKVQNWQVGCELRLELTDYNTDMIGLCTGSYNNLLVLDVDEKSIFQQVAEYFNLLLPETLTVKTGRGYHYYYLYPSDLIKHTNRVFKYLGFDIRASGGYVVALGSSYPNGKNYIPVNGLKSRVAPPEWLVLITANNGELNFILSRLNIIRKHEIDSANNNHQPIPTFNLENLVSSFLKQYPYYEAFLYQFPSYKKSLEGNMSKNTTSYNPFEVSQKQEIIIPTNTQNLLNQSPPEKHRSEPIMSAITSLINSGFSNEQVKDIMLSSPLGEKLIQKGSQFTDREIASANAFVQANPPKKQKINIEHEAYAIMLQQSYVKDVEGRLYCRVIQSKARIEYIDVKSDSFYGIIGKFLHIKFNKSIVPTKFKPLLTILIEEKRLAVPTVPIMNRFYQDGNKLIYDLGRDDYQCIEITPNKVVQVSHPDMILERSILYLPITNIDFSNGDDHYFEQFWDLCEIKEVYQRHFLNIVILSYLFNNISSPILYLYGDQGSGKTRLALSIKNIFDPWEAGVVMPTKLDNFRLLLNQAGIGFIDNFSELPQDKLNDLCNAYSGGLDYHRQLFHDKKGIKLNIKCPMILASVNIPKKLPLDFISRTVFIKINPKHNRLTERELKEKLDNLYPKIRGEMFNLASKVLPIMANYKPTNLSRHADLDLIGQAYCDLYKTPLSYSDIFHKINIDSAFAVTKDEPLIRKFIEIVLDRKFITFTMAEMARIMNEDTNLDFKINEGQLGKDLKPYSNILHQLNIKFYNGVKLSGGAKPCVAFVDDNKSIPDGIDASKFYEFPEYVTEIYLRYHKTETGKVIDDMLDNS